MLRFHDDPAVMAELGGVRDERQTSEYLSRNLDHWSAYGFGIWMLRELEREVVVGRALLRHLEIEGRDEVEVGYALYPRYWGRGLASEIAESCVAFARHDLGLESLVGVTTLGNQGSQRVLAKLGMLRERELRFKGTSCWLFRIRWAASASD
jgi:RimJ/RimL family protein N-acetyltransferase